jgi:sterol desaturase/sphingolipid hydroxylase (fatty acid hydroxylase superfamily)
VTDTASSNTTAARNQPVQWLLYPTVMFAAIALAWTVHHLGAPLTLAAYLAVAVSGLTVFFSEKLIPYRRDWDPTAPELRDDGLFMLFVQVLLPLGLSWLAVRATQGVLAASGLTLHLWPVSWPLWAQVILKIASGDFLRYWLHRWSHEHDLLWRLHAVHHHPRKLYAVNVFRFHPMDKALQFLCDTLPFILLGVGPDVLAFYFVIYATGGFFQHSNLDVRYGWLNYLVVGPELHRWHHSRQPIESNANYAHTFVLWDLLFGSYRRPVDRQVSALGLLDEAYPSRFLPQLWAPLRRTGSASDHAGG